MLPWREFRQELPPLVRLAAPLVIAELGWMTMGVVDTIMVGRLSKEAMGGVSIGGILFYAIAVFGMGVLLGLDTLVSQSFGAGRIEDCHHSLVSGLWLGAMLSPPLMALVALGMYPLRWLGIQQAILAQAGPYLDSIVWSLPPLLVYAALRRYLQGMNLTAPVTIALLTANLVNAAANYALIFGHWGMPALGAAGAGWATTISRVYVVAVLVGYAAWWDRRVNAGLRHAPPGVDWARIRELWRLGLPASAQITLEVGVFALAGALIGRFPAQFIAAHQIALNAASMTFMVPLGLGSAAAVRVGQAVGRGDAAAAARAGWMAIMLGGAFMALAGVCFVAFPGWIGRAYTNDAAVIATASVLLWIAALFQFFDGLQGVTTGALRGLGDTRTAAVTHMVSYWIIGLPLGCWLAFGRNWYAAGMWTGLCVSLITIGVVLVAVWRRRVSELRLVPVPVSSSSV
ncbi:MAG: MATE family efflux transporter [Bryobacterales bacterium]|nr:MATE family efflux transporter [Bryobacterales bacterium]